MASTKEFAEFVCDQIRGCGAVRYRKMFGEYMVYVNDKPLLLVCDNTVYVKMLPESGALLGGGATGRPYDGAREHYVLDVEDREKALKVIEALEPVTAVPAKRRKKR